MARIDWIELRLQNWARWNLSRGGGVLGYAAVALTDADAGRDGYITAVIPTSDVEAAETDDAINRLYPGGLRLAVIEVYVGRGGMKDKCLRLCAAESTVYARIDAAHRQLADHFLVQQDRGKTERARVELLQRTAVRGF